jgi:viroplasmin and RNaseH domain-containing protein
LRFVTNKAYKTFIADERAREFARENSRIKTENYDLR